MNSVDGHSKLYVGVECVFPEVTVEKVTFSVITGLSLHVLGLIAMFCAISISINISLSSVQADGRKEFCVFCIRRFAALCMNI